MSIPERLYKFLRKNHIPYEIVVHPLAFTAGEMAEQECVSGRSVAKVVMVKARGKDQMLVLPASHSIDFLKLSALLGTQDVQIEEESEFSGLFPDCEAGAMPPFGSLYHLPCFIDQSLGGTDFVDFNGGNHQETVRLSAVDFVRAVKGKWGDFAVPGRRLAERR